MRTAAHLMEAVFKPAIRANEVPAVGVGLDELSEAAGQ
jgi:hypothetical protein